MVDIEVRNGLYHVRGPKFEPYLTKAEFIQALRWAEWVKRRQALQARQTASVPWTWGGKPLTPSRELGASQAPGCSKSEQPSLVR
jgi:hypothetical protein